MDDKRMTLPELENVKCPECQGEMTPRTSKHGKFWGCKSFPRCKGTRDSMGRSKNEKKVEEKEEYGDDYRED
jgi:ssDNA-binding Zn-finger/Zn-ribbon topoisomerase 1